MMAIESWLPIGFVFPDGAVCGRALHEGRDWQIVAIGGEGRALIARDPLRRDWLASGLIDSTDMRAFSFGSAALFAASSPRSQMLAPVNAGRSPNNKSEAMAFAMALKATRQADADSALQDAIYVERFGRLLPTYGSGPRDDDDMVLGAWLTGGARVSAHAARLTQMLSWLGPSHLLEIVTASGVTAWANSSPESRGDSGDVRTADRSADRKDESALTSDATEERQPRPGQTAFDSGQPFELAGRPEIEDFFNEHVVDIVRHKTRYAALGVGFPAAIVLHGPPGCGKTFAVEQLIEYLGWPSFQVDASSVASPYIHETSKKVAEVFARAMKNAPSVLVLDEMEAFLADRESGGGSSHHRVEEVAEFLRRIPEAVKNEVLVVAMTNRLQMIDPAILRRGRFDHIIAVEPATQDEIEALLKKLIDKLPAQADVDVRHLARRLAGRPLSDVTFVVREGARLCARAGFDRIEQRFLDDALNAALARGEPGAGRRIGFV